MQLRLRAHLLIVLALGGSMFSASRPVQSSDSASHYSAGKQMAVANFPKGTPAVLYQDEGKPSSLAQAPMECEGAATRLDFAVIETKKIERAHLIIIARPGDNEVSPRLNERRLKVIKEYVLRRGSDLKYVLAQGERVKSLGRIELYVAGQLYEILPYKKNAVSHCQS